MEALSKSRTFTLFALKWQRKDADLAADSGPWSFSKSLRLHRRSMNALDARTNLSELINRPFALRQIADCMPYTMHCIVCSVWRFWPAKNGKARFWADARESESKCVPNTNQSSTLHNTTNKITLTDNGYVLLPWCAWMLDISPIENKWGIAKHNQRDFDSQMKTIAEFIPVVLWTVGIMDTPLAIWRCDSLYPFFWMENFILPVWKSERNGTSLKLAVFEPILNQSTFRFRSISTNCQEARIKVALCRKEHCG